MKRTLIELTAGLAVGVLLFSLHHQVARLKANTHGVASLQQPAKESITPPAPATVASESVDALAKLERKLSDLEVRIAEASQNTAGTNDLRQALERERDEYNKFRQEIMRDVDRTKTLIDTYVDELRTSSKRAHTSIEVTRSDLQRVMGRVERDHRTLTRDMLAPTVQLNGDDTVGSGTLVFSGAHPTTAAVESYILTSYHVVRNILADTPSAKSAGIATTIYGNGSDRLDLRSDMVLHDARIDAALLRLRSKERFHQLARVLRRDDAERVEVWRDVYAVGCPLGNDPIPSNGAISSLKNELNSANYWMINAPTYFGNSGGGVYLADTRELVGVFSKIYTHGKSTPVVIPHMGLCTPITLIHDWLSAAKLGWILGESGNAESTELASPPK